MTKASTQVAVDRNGSEGMSFRGGHETEAPAAGDGGCFQHEARGGEPTQSQNSASGATAEADDDPLRRLIPFAHRAFCAWRSEPEQKTGRLTKRPYCSRDRRAQSDNPATFLTRASAEVLARENGFDGVGVFLGDHLGDSVLCGVDLDPRIERRVANRRGDTRPRGGLRKAGGRRRRRGFEKLAA